MKIFVVAPQKSPWVTGLCITLEDRGHEVVTADDLESAKACDTVVVTYPRSQPVRVLQRWARDRGMRVIRYDPQSRHASRCGTLGQVCEVIDAARV